MSSRFLAVWLQVPLPCCPAAAAAALLPPPPLPPLLLLPPSCAAPLPCSAWAAVDSSRFLL